MKKDVIQALMDGKQVQFREIFGFKSDELKEWTDLDINNHAELYASLFTDDEGFKWRIKPVTFKYRVGLFKYGNFYPMLITNDEVAEAVERDDNTFVSWITDWVEYTIEN